MQLSLPKQFPLFILVSSVYKSLQCLISALTQGGKGGHLFRLTCSVVLWGGRNTANKYHWCVWGGSACSVWFTLSLPPLIACVLSPSTLLSLQVALQGNCLKWALGYVHFPDLSRSGSGSNPQRHRLGWACVLCPSHVQAAQATRCLASAFSSSGVVHLITSPVPAARFPGCAVVAPSQMCCVSPLGS